jgi:DNA-binding XRE family transcriptional regulator
MANATLDYSEHNKKIAKLRGNDWKRKLRIAKLRQKDGKVTAMAASRAEIGITQRDMMKHLGTNNNTIYARIERGDVSTNKDRAEAISRVLNKKVEELFIEFDKNRFMAI